MHIPAMLVCYCLNAMGLFTVFQCSVIHIHSSVCAYMYVILHGACTLSDFISAIITTPVPMIVWSFLTSSPGWFIPTVI